VGWLWSGYPIWEHLEKEGAPHEVVEAPPPDRDLDQYWFDPEWRAADLHDHLDGITAIRHLDALQEIENLTCFNGRRASVSRKVAIPVGTIFIGAFGPLANRSCQCGWT